MATLCEHISVSANTVDNWVARGILPAPRKRGGKLMWKWVEVDEYLSEGRAGSNPDSQAERIKNGTRRATENRAGY